MRPVSKVFQCRFWTHHFGLPCPKPTMVFGNLYTMYGLNKGPLTKKHKKKMKKKGFRTSSILAITYAIPVSEWNPAGNPKMSFRGTYFDSSGVRKFKGRKKDLKATQQLASTLKTACMERVFKFQESTLKARTRSSMSPCIQEQVPFPVEHRSPRSYTANYGACLADLYRKQLLLPPQRDLRVRIPLDQNLTDREMFANMETGDTWTDALMKDVFEYLWTSKHCRTPSCSCQLPDGR